MAESQGPGMPRRKTLAFSRACHLLLSSYLGYILNFQSLSHALSNARRLHNGAENTENCDYFDKVVGGIVRDQQVIHIPALLHSANMKAAFDMPNAMIFWCSGKYFLFLSNSFLLESLISGWPSHRNSFESCFIDPIAGI
jgi:hypothetical protein